MTSDRVGSGGCHGFGVTFGGQVCIQEVGEKCIDMSNSILIAIPTVPLKVRLTSSDIAYPTIAVPLFHDHRASDGTDMSAMPQIAVPWMGPR